MSSKALSVQMTFGVMKCWVIISRVNWRTMSRTCLQSLMRYTQLTRV